MKTNKTTNRRGKEKARDGVSLNGTPGLAGTPALDGPPSYPVSRPDPELAALPDRRGGSRAAAGPGLQEEVKRVLLSRYTPAAFLIDDGFNVLHVQGKLAPFLLSEPGAPAVNLLRLVKEGLSVVIRAALLTAKSEDRAVRRSTHCTIDGRDIGIGIEVLSIRVEQERRRRYLVLFKLDGTAPGGPENGADRQLVFQAPVRGAPAPAPSSDLAPRGAHAQVEDADDELSIVKREIQAASEELISVNRELRERNQEATATNDDLSNLLASVEIPIVMLDMEMRVRRSTPPAGKAFGVGPSDLGRSILSLNLNVEVPQLKENIRAVLAGFGVRHLEVTDGQDRWYALWIRPYRTNANVIDGAVLSLLDITEKRNGIRRLVAARDYAEAIVDTVSDPLLILNRQLKVVRASRSYYGVFHAAPAEVEGRSIFELSKGRWSVAPLRKHLSALAAGKTPFSNLELDFDVPKLGSRTLAISGRAVPHESDSGLNFVVVIADVSPRKQAAEAAALRKSEARQRDFVANVSHELLTPITAIKGYAESLIAGALEAPNQRVKFTQIIERHADRLSQLVEDILQLSSHDAGLARSSAESVPLRGSIDKLVRSLAPVSRKRAVSISVRMPKSLRVVISRAELSQVMQNLCENAIKYNRRNGRVYIQAREVGRRAVVSVRDTGIGIPKEDLPRVFDRFHRADNARRNTARGTGLGLSIVRSILAKRGCRVWAESDLGKGTAIFFTLPLVERPRRRVRAAPRHLNAGKK